jgi:LPS-assembly protein
MGYNLKKVAVLLCCVSLIFVNYTFAQRNGSSNSNQRRYKFAEDVSTTKRAKQIQERTVLKKDSASTDVVDIKAPSLNFEKDSKTVVADGGLVLSGNGIQAESKKGTFNTETKDAILEGDVTFTGMSAKVKSERAAVNLDDETGQFTNGSFLYEEGGYNISAKEIFKLSETRYRLIDSDLSTCECFGEECPWMISSDDARITQSGYARTWNSTLWFHGVPVFYSPYLAFPAKFERTSGLMAPSFGYNSVNGFQYSQPIFIAASESADLSLTPFIETKTRYGSNVDVKKIFSDDNKIESRLLYSNETPRDGDLRGLLVQDLVNSGIDDNRLGFYYNHIYRAPSDAALPLRFIADIHRTSDATMVKEFADPLIADPTQRFNTSSVSLRSALGEFFSMDVGAEYNDLIFGRPGQDKFTFHRMPEASLSFLRSFRPIENPYGLRLVTKANLTQTYFDRSQGYDGSRTVFQPETNVPFHLSNYFAGSLGGGAYVRSYSMSNTDIFDPANPNGQAISSIEDSSSSRVPYLQGNLGTAFERVYGLDRDSWLVDLAGLGKENQDDTLVRVKHTIEPTLRYLYIPDITQTDNPQYDALDRITERSLLRYGVSTALIGRFDSRSDVATGVPEFAPEVSDFPSFDSVNPLPEFGRPESVGLPTGATNLRNGSVRELLRLSIEQGYDWRRAYRRDQQIDSVGQSNILPLTDVTTSLSTNPNKNFAAQFDTYYNTDQSRITGFSLSSKLSTDRGDSVYLRYSFAGEPTENRAAGTQVDQVDGGFETLLTDRTRFGIYTRYNNLDNELINSERGIINNRMALRFYSSCNCWHADVGYSDQVNPDNQTFYFNFTFTGLGDISQDILNVRPTSAQ